MTASPRKPCARRAALAIALALSCAVPGVRAEDPAPKVALSLPAQPLGSALNALARALGQPLIADAALLAGREAPALEGRFTAEQAFARLLERSGLEAVRASGGGYVVRALKDRGTGPAELALPPIVVTGERVNRDLAATASSVSVLDETDLARRGGIGVFDASRGLPNIGIHSVSEMPSVRGVESAGAGGAPSGVLQGTPPRAPLVIDEIARPAGIPNVGFTGLWDVESVEYFRGPQSTVRGRNAIAGAFVVRTKDPTWSPEFSLLGGLAWNETGGLAVRTAAMASGALVEDRVAGRATVEYDGGNDPRNIYNVPSGRDGSTLTGFDQTRVRGKLRITPDGPAGALSILLLGEHQRGTVPQTRDTIAGPGAPGAPSFTDRTYPYNVGARVFRTEGSVAGADIRYDLGGNRALRSITSYVADSFRSTDAQPDPIRFDVEDRLYNQDVLYTFGDGGSAVEGLVGLNVNQRIQDARASGATRATTNTTSQAAFADVSWRFAPGLTALAGGRLHRNRDTRDQVSLITPGTTHFEKTETVLLPKVGLLWDLDEHNTLGATLRDGYNSGGGSVNFFTGVPYQFESERVRTVEAVYRNRSAGGRVATSLTVFHNSHDNPQFYVRRVPTSPFSLEVVNMARGRSYGTELEARVRATRTLEVSASLGYLATRITEATAAQPGLEGNRFGRDPRYTISTGALWQATPELAIDGRATWVSRFYTDINNNENEIAGAFAILDAGATYRPRRDTTVRVFVRNLTDRLAFTRRIGVSYADVIPPRTLGASIQFDF